MTEELDTKRRRLATETWKGNLDVMDELIAHNYVGHVPPFKDTIGREGARQRMRGLLSAFSNVDIIIEESLTRADTCVVRYRWKAMHTGRSPILGILPTAKNVSMIGCVVSHWQDGRIIEEWEYDDIFGLLKQLEVVPSLP